MMKKFAVLLLLVMTKALAAQPGKNGVYTVNAANVVVNKYSPLKLDITAGSNTLVVVPGPSFSLCPGDLIIVYQAQGMPINYVAGPNYGAISSYLAGTYEFLYVSAVNANTITVQGSFTYTYSALGRAQVVKVPQFTTLTINSGASLVAKKWKDTTISSTLYRFGGIVAVHATNIVNNGTISASSAGFRGGQVSLNSTVLNYGTNLYVSSSVADGGEKGEGVAGYHAEYDNNLGRYCRGAAANGGGGGNAINAPGGGGANGYNGNAWTGQGVMVVNNTNPLACWALDPGYIANGNSLTNSSGGGRGGYSWANLNANAATQGPGNTAWSGDNRREVGGMGGRPLTSVNANSTIYFGGGGGAGHQNNLAATAGSSGGGIVYLISTSGISGAGLIESNGGMVADPPGCSCDGAGGGGAGGSIIIKTGSIATSQTVTANGANGGKQLALSGPAAIHESEGTGGGGGGGFVAISSTGITAQVKGGSNGSTVSTGVTEMTSNGATEGATGQTTAVSADFVQYISSTTSNTNCGGNTLGFNSPSNKTENSKDVLIYPNPGKGTFVITSSEPLQLQLVNELGQLIRKIELNEENSYHLQLSDLATGIYFIQNLNGRARVNQKLVVLE